MWKEKERECLVVLGEREFLQYYEMQAADLWYISCVGCTTASELLKPKILGYDFLVLLFIVTKCFKFYLTLFCT